ncbi:ArsA-related P-loop ATPase [Cupriavidus basilensis]
MGRIHLLVHERRFLPRPTGRPGKAKALYAATVERLSSADETTVILVARADTASLREANRTRAELADLGIRNQTLVINGMFSDATSGDPIATAMAQRATEALTDMPAELAGMPQTRIPFLPRGTVGLDALREMAHPETVASPTKP